MIRPKTSKHTRGIELGRVPAKPHIYRSFCYGWVLDDGRQFLVSKQPSLQAVIETWKRGEECSMSFTKLEIENIARERFEANCPLFGFSTERNEDGSYRNQETQKKWEQWHAGFSQSFIPRGDDD